MEKLKILYLRFGRIVDIDYDDIQMSIEKVSVCVGARYNTVRDFLSRFKRTNEISKKREGKKKISKHLALKLASHECQASWIHMTLKDRVQMIKEKHNLKLTSNCLRQFYKNNHISYRKPAWKFHNPRSPIEIHNGKKDFIIKLTRLLKKGTMVAYLDETSSHRWEKLSKIWTSADNPIKLKLAKDRGRSVTIIGAICSSWAIGSQFQYQLCDKTTISNLKPFFQNKIKPLVPKEGCVVVLDSHPSHTSDKFQNWVYELKNITFMFIPPGASELNPIEYMWAYFKREWAKQLYNPTIQIPIEDTRKQMAECLERIQKNATTLSKGPLKYMRDYISPEHLNPFRRITRRVATNIQNQSRPPLLGISDNVSMDGSSDTDPFHLSGSISDGIVSNRPKKYRKETKKENKK